MWKHDFIRHFIWHNFLEVFFARSSKCFLTLFFLSTALHEKCPNTEFFLVGICPHSDWIRTRKKLTFDVVQHSRFCPMYFSYFNVFYFTSKVLIVLEIFKSYNFQILNFITSSNAFAWNKKYVLLNNLGTGHSLVMEFDQFIA